MFVAQKERDFDMKITKIGNDHSEILKKVAQTIPNEGTPGISTGYSDEAVNSIEVNETGIIGALSYAKEHVMAADWQNALKAIEKAKAYVEQMAARGRGH